MLHLGCGLFLAAAEEANCSTRDLCSCKSIKCNPSATFSAVSYNYRFAKALIALATTSRIQQVYRQSTDLEPVHNGQAQVLSTQLPTRGSKIRSSSQPHTIYNHVSQTKSLAHRFSRMPDRRQPHCNVESVKFNHSKQVDVDQRFSPIKATTLFYAPI